MPFKSERQRKWMWANEPEMARQWENEEKMAKKKKKPSKLQKKGKPKHGSKRPGLSGEMYKAGHN